MGLLAPQPNPGSKSLTFRFQLQNRLQSPVAGAGVERKETTERARSTRYRARSSSRSVLSPGPGPAGGVEPAMKIAPKNQCRGGAEPSEQHCGCRGCTPCRAVGRAGEERGLIPIPSKARGRMVSPCWGCFRCWLRVWEKFEVKWSNPTFLPWAGKWCSLWWS